MNKFGEVNSKINEETLQEVDEYISSIPFISETTVKQDDAYKKKIGQYVKYKTIPKWHHYAWDMIK